MVTRIQWMNSLFIRPHGSDAMTAIMPHPRFDRDLFIMICRNLAGGEHKNATI